MPIYVDTSAWIALHEPRDTNHGAAKDRLQALVAAQEILVAGLHTIVELADGLARHYGQREASAELERLLSSPRLRVESSEPHLQAAREIFRGRTNWEVDLSDCLSFAFMKAKGIQRAFTYDRDFLKAGFQVEA
ncbi:MAG TPA: PIN domain-containing protein [Candidatus Thermoplasmatota archaeon]|nr:PIN domain-containing protein [Candidatus Thermoplasmatota archaeon]